MTAKEVRRARGIPLIEVAVLAHVSETTARVYEADRMAVSERKRAALDRVYAGLRAGPRSPTMSLDFRDNLCRPGVMR